MKKAQSGSAAIWGLGFVLLALTALGAYVVSRIVRSPTAISLSQLGLGSPRAVTEGSSWLLPNIGSLSIQDVNADGYDDCVVWLLAPTLRPGRLQVIDGRTGLPGYAAATFGAQLAAISGTKLVYASDPEPTHSTGHATSPLPTRPRLLLADLRAGKTLASEEVPDRVSDLYAVADGFVARSSFSNRYVDTKQDKIFLTGTSSSQKASLVGDSESTPEHPFVEQALRRLRWDKETIEPGLQRLKRQGPYWVVPRDRSYAHLAVLNQAELERSWEFDLGEGSITQLAVGRDLIGVVLHTPGENDQLLLLELQGRRIVFRYQRG